MKGFLLCTALLLAIPLGWAVLGAEDPRKRIESPKEGEEVAALMHQKLEQAQKVLEGVALGDFDRISKASSEIVQISKRAQFLVMRTPKYDLYANDFRRSAEALIQNAKDRNLDAAALTYVDLTLTCVRCHKYVREVRHGRLEIELPRDLRAGR